MIHTPGPHTFSGRVAALATVLLISWMSRFCPTAAADAFPVAFLPDAAPAPSSVTVSISGPVIGTATDSSCALGRRHTGRRNTHGSF